MQKEIIYKVFKPNIPFTSLKNLYVNTGDLGHISSILEKEPETFMVYGERGAGKSILFHSIVADSLLNICNEFNESKISQVIRTISPFSKPRSHKIKLFVYYPIIQDSKNQLFELLHGITYSLIKMLLAFNEITGLLKQNRDFLLKTYFRLENKDVSESILSKRSIGLDLGISIPINFHLKKNEENIYGKQIYAGQIKTIRELHQILLKLSEIVKEPEIDQIVIIPDELDKLDVKTYGKILKIEQGPLFETLRDSFSFLLPVQQKHLNEFQKQEYQGIFTHPVYRLKKFDFDFSHELLQKRIEYYEDLIQIKERVSIVDDNLLKKLIQRSNGIPRSILLEVIKSLISGNSSH